MRIYWGLILCLAACSQQDSYPLPATPATEDLPAPAARLIMDGYQQLFENRSDPALWGAYGDALLANGRWDQAVIAYEGAHAKDPQNPQWASHLAELHHRNSSLGDADFYARVARQLAPENPQLAFLAARIYEDLGNYEEALTAYRETSQLLPQRPEVELALGRLLLNLGHFDESRQHLAAAMQMAPQSRAVRAAVSRLLNAAPQLKAIEVPAVDAVLESDLLLPPPFQERVARNMRRLGDLDNHWRAAFARGDKGAALHSLDLIREHYPDNTSEEHWINSAFIQAAYNRRGDARRTYLACIERFPDSADGHLGLADFAFLEGDKPTAERHFETALAHATTPLQKARALQGTGRIAAQDGRLPAALELLRQAEQASPDLGVLQMDMALVLADLQRYDAAWQRIARAEELGFQVSENFKSQLRRVSGR